MVQQRLKAPEAVREFESYLAMSTHPKLLHLHGFFLDNESFSDITTLAGIMSGLPRRGFLTLDNAWRYSHHMLLGLDHLHHC